MEQQEMGRELRREHAWSVDGICMEPFLQDVAI